MDNDYFKTSDLALVATLSLFFPVEFIDKTNPHKAEFAFRKSSDLEKLVDRYWKQKLQVEPQAYFMQLKVIKTRLYSRE